MTANPRVTVGIPTFNRADKWLGEAIGGVLAQTVTEFELIVSDNASADNTAEFVHSFGDRRIRYSRSEHNVGNVGNYNRLLELADSEFVVLLADDDLLYPEYLEATLELMDRFDTAGLVHTASNLIDRDSKVVRCSRPLKSRAPSQLERRDKARERLMTSHWPLSFSSVMYRREALLAAGEFRADQEPFSDLYLWLRIALDWDLGYIPRPLSALRDHSESITANIGTDPDANPSAPDPRLVHGEERFKRRMTFLEGAPLPIETRDWLSALASLALLCEQADAGPAWPEVLRRVARIARAQPRIVTQRVFWLVVLRVEPWRQRLIAWRRMASVVSRVRA